MVPVRLHRASNYKISNNPEGWLAVKSMKHAEDLLSLFGPALASFIMQDDKAFVPTGIQEQINKHNC